MNRTRIEAFVPGAPRAMGSKVAAVTRDGRPFVRDMRPKALKDWQKAVRSALIRAAVGADPAGLLAGWAVEINVLMERPRSHLRARGGVKGGQPKRPPRPDIDKIARAVLDCGTGILWLDDRQVAELTIQKAYAPPASDRYDPNPAGLVGTTIEAWPIEEPVGLFEEER